MPFDGRDYQPNLDIDNAVELLRAVRIKLAFPQLWRKGCAYGDDGSLCLLAAIYLSIGQNPSLSSKQPRVVLVDQAIYQAIKTLYPSHLYSPIHKFNDHPDTTFAMIHEVIDLAEETLKERRV